MLVEDVCTTCQSGEHQLWKEKSNTEQWIVLNNFNEIHGFEDSAIYDSADEIILTDEEVARAEADRIYLYECYD